MLINNITYRERNNSVTLSADITFRKNKKERMFITVDRKYKQFIYKDASPFLAAVLLPCMWTKEDIVIEGNVSQALLQGTHAIMNQVEKWQKGFHRVAIRTSGIEKDNIIAPYTGCFFSGGVDSFYTYLKHRKKKNTISHFILVHGFDIELENTTFFNTVLSGIHEIARKEHLTVISVKTNIAKIIEPRLVWDWAHGGALAAVGLTLRTKLKRLYISSALRYDELFPYGTHPLIDPHWSTETLQVVHDGNEYSRLEKVVRVISKSPLALRHLRVCCQNMKGKYNCSRCFKCLGTMIELTCGNALKKSYTFEKPLNLSLVKNMYYDYTYGYNLIAEQNLEFLKKENSYPLLQEAIQYSLQRSKRFSFKRRITQLISYIDQHYTRRRIYTFIFTLNKQKDRSVLFKFLSTQGFIK